MATLCKASYSPPPTSTQSIITQRIPPSVATEKTFRMLGTRVSTFLEWPDALAPALGYGQGGWSILVFFLQSIHQFQFTRTLQ